eukprot:1141259-Pelagomonas_calceolata.AAC.4
MMAWSRYINDSNYSGALQWQMDVDKHKYCSHQQQASGDRFSNLLDRKRLNGSQQREYLCVPELHTECTGVWFVLSMPLDGLPVRRNAPGFVPRVLLTFSADFCLFCALVGLMLRQLHGQESMLLCTEHLILLMIQARWLMH